MKLYEIEVTRTSYITYSIPAQSREAAELRALELAEEDYGSAEYAARTIEENEEN